MVSIVRFAGTNCEFDMQYVYEGILGIPSAIIWHQEKALPRETKLVVIPGGFSYGDYLRSGAIARFAPIMKAVKDFGAKGGRILGICNGFQILTEAKLLPGALMRNKNLHFISENTPIKIASNKNPFLRDYQKDEIISLPVAHADGNYYIDKKGLESLQENDQILMRYACDINGSIDSIAGICNKEKNIFGLMPHPERASEHITQKLASNAHYAPDLDSASSASTSARTTPHGLSMLESIYKA